MEKPRLPHFLLTGLIALILMAGICSLTGFNGLYGQDAHAYTQHVQKIQALWLTGEPLPSFFWPIGYPVMGAATGILVPGIPGTQLFTMLALAGSLVYFQLLLQYAYPKAGWRIVVYSLLAFLMAPYVLRAGLVAMADIPALFLSLGAVYHTFQFRQHPVWFHVLIAGFLGGLAVFTRYAAGLVLLMPALVMLVNLIRQKQALFWLVGLAGVASGMLPQFLLEGVFQTDLGQHGFSQQWSLLNLFRSSFENSNGEFDYAVFNLVYALFNTGHPAYLFFGIPVLFFMRKADFQPFTIKILLAAFALYALFLAGLPFQNKRFLLLNFTFWLVVAFPAFNRGLNWAEQWLRLKPVWLLSLALLVQIGLFARVLNPFLERSQLEQQIAQHLQERSPDRLYTFSLDVALTTYKVPQKLINLQHDSIGAAAKGDWVLFNEPALADQWQGQAVMEHWKQLNQEFELKPVKGFPEGWTLYRLT